MKFARRTPKQVRLPRFNGGVLICIATDVEMIWMHEFQKAALASAGSGDVAVPAHLRILGA